MLRVALVSIVMLCGSPASNDGDHTLCHIVAALPSSTLLARPSMRATSSSLAEAVHPVRGKGAGAASVTAAGNTAVCTWAAVALVAFEASCGAAPMCPCDPVA